MENNKNIKKSDIIESVEWLKNAIEEYNNNNKDEKFYIDLNLTHYLKSSSYADKLNGVENEPHKFDLKYSNRKDGRYYNRVNREIFIGQNIVDFNEIKNKYLGGGK